MVLSIKLPYNITKIVIQYHILPYYTMINENFSFCQAIASRADVQGWTSFFFVWSLGGSCEFHHFTTEPPFNHHSTTMNSSLNHHEIIMKSSFNHHEIIIKSSWNHHSTTMKSSLNHHEIIMKSSFNHHEIIIKSSWNHHSTTMKSSLNHHSTTMKSPWNHHSTTIKSSLTLDLPILPGFFNALRHGRQVRLPWLHPHPSGRSGALRSTVQVAPVGGCGSVGTLTSDRVISTRPI